MRIDFLGLEAFLAVAERGGFRPAAAHLNLSQTALSHRMRKLEDDLGQRLFTRSGRRVTLTPAGLELLPDARRLFADLTGAYEALRGRGRSRDARLAIGCLPTVAVDRLPAVLADFAVAHPGVRVQIRDRAAGEIADLVERGEVAFAVTILAANRWDFDARPLFKEPWVLVARADHPFARRDAVTWADLEGHPLVRVSSQTANRTLIDDALGSRREAMVWRWEVDHLATAIRLVEVGAALAVVPRSAIPTGDGGGLRAVALRGPSLSRTLGIVTKRGAPLSDLARDLADRLVAAYAETDAGRTDPD